MEMAATDLANALHREFCACGDGDLNSDFHGPAHRARFQQHAHALIASGAITKDGTNG